MKQFLIFTSFLLLVHCAAMLEADEQVKEHPKLDAKVIKIVARHKKAKIQRMLR